MRRTSPAVAWSANRREENPRRVADALERAPHGAALQGLERVRGAERALRVACQRFDPRARNAHAEEIRRDVLDLVRLVEDDRVVSRQDARVAAARPRTEGEVGEQEVMIDDDDLRLFGLAAHARHEARLEVLAPRPDARLARRRDVPPYVGVFGQVGELRAVAALGLTRPLHDATQDARPSPRFPDARASCIRRRHR